MIWAEEALKYMNDGLLKPQNDMLGKTGDVCSGKRQCASQTRVTTETVSRKAGLAWKLHQDLFGKACTNAVHILKLFATEDL